MRYCFIAILACYMLPSYCIAQEEMVVQSVLIKSDGFLDRIQHKTGDIEKKLSRQTERYLQKTVNREARIRKKLSHLDQIAANNLFNGSADTYAVLAQKIRTDTGNTKYSLRGEYQPYTDSLKVMLDFIKHYFPGPAEASNQLQTLQAKIQEADHVKEYIRQRKQQIGAYISNHAEIAGALSKQYQGMNKDLYYYSQSVRQYKEFLNDPDQLELKALSLLNKLPAFQAFMKQNSQLAGLFNLPSNYGTSEGLEGLQTREQVSALINSQVTAGGAGGQAALQANLQSAQSQLDGYKQKLNQLGRGSGDIDMPNFNPYNEKTKTFWKRFEYGANFQTTHNSYYFPTTSDLGISVGYKVNNSSTIGIGASYKLGWGNGIQHISFSSQGVGLRSFIDVKVKSSWFASGGFEYNHVTPFQSMQQLHKWDDWNRSALVGISKMLSVKSRVFKKTKLQLLWDLLSYQQNPKTQPLLFRIGYGF